MKNNRSRYKPAYKPFSERRSERKLKRNIIFTIFILGFLIYFLITWFIPTLVGGLSYLNRFKETPQPNQNILQEVLAPPVLNIPFEATNTASIVIKGYSSSNHTVEIYIDDQMQAVAEVKDDGSFETDPVDLNLGTNNIYGKTVNDQGDKSLPSKTIRILYDNEKPKMELKEPSDNLEVKDSRKIIVSGNTEMDAVVEINNARAIVNFDGNFSYSLELDEGENTIVITATDKAGNITQISRRVIYAP